MTVTKMRLALIAHDGRKADMVAFATYNRDRLAEFDLVATATTGHLLIEKVGLACQKVLSGPQGGDAQISAMVAEGRALLLPQGPGLAAELQAGAARLMADPALLASQSRPEANRAVALCLEDLAGRMKA